MDSRRWGHCWLVGGFLSVAQKTKPRNLKPRIFVASRIIVPSSAVVKLTMSIHLMKCSNARGKTRVIQPLLFLCFTRIRCLRVARFFAD
jgi:hypothetical protein